LIPIEKKKIFNEDVEKLQLRTFQTGNFGKKTLKKLEKAKKGVKPQDCANISLRIRYHNKK